MEVSLRSLFRDFNASKFCNQEMAKSTCKFLLYLCLFFFFILFSLRLDGLLELNYAIIFIPIWLLEAIIFVGAAFAIISFIVSPPSRSEIALRSDFYCLSLCTGEHALLFLFEILTCYKLQTNASIDELPWLLVFAPIFALSLLSIVVAIWAIRNDKSFELELFFSINIVQFLFVAFKLDDILEWHWTIVFIPLWIILSLCVIGVIYAFVLAIIFVRSMHLMETHRRQHLYSAMCHTFLIIPVIIFLILLTGKLDSLMWTKEKAISQLPYIVVFLPLLFTLFCLVLMSFGVRGGNPWWFAMRSPFCNFLLNLCPCLKLNANLSYKFGVSQSNDNSLHSDDPSIQSINSVRLPMRPVVPIQYIESLD